MSSAGLLIFAYGNISRGDDALAPLLIQRLKQQDIQHGCGCQIKYLVDYQIHIEHALDMQHCRRVMLIDAAQDFSQAYRFYSIHPRQQTLYTTHGMSPATLLHTYQQVVGEAPPPTAMLAIRGYHFELGQGLSAQAEDNLEQALGFITLLLEPSDFFAWDSNLSTI